MTIDEFCIRHPRLYHMATADSLGQIKKHGLLCTEAICDLVGVDMESRERLIAERRAELVTLEHAEHGRFVLRDQKPMLDSKLQRCLVNISLKDWYRLLNRRVFMWANKERVETLMQARAYRKHDQLILTLDSRPLIEMNLDRVSVSTINSGATFYTPVPRGEATFTPLSQFDPTLVRKPVVEVTVSGGVPNFADYIIDHAVRRAA